MASRKFKLAIHRRPKAKPALRPVQTRPDPIAKRLEQVGAADLQASLRSSTAMAAFSRR
jgi:hypothetical protein